MFHPFLVDELSLFNLVLCIQHIPDDGPPHGCFFLTSPTRLNSCITCKGIFYILQHDSNIYAAAKAQVKECCEKSKSGDSQFRCIYTSTKACLRSTVGEFYWKKAHDYLDHLLNQKRETHQMEINERVQQQGQVQQQRSRVKQQSRVQQQQVTPSFAHLGGNPSLTVRIPTPPPTSHHLSTLSRFAAIATTKDPMPVPRPSYTAEPPYWSCSSPNT